MSDYHLALAGVCYRAGNWPEAAACREAMRFDPESVEAQYRSPKATGGLERPTTTLSSRSCCTSNLPAASSGNNGTNSKSRRGLHI